MAEPNYGNLETAIDIKDIIKTFRKRMGLIVSIFLILAIGAGIISFLIPPTYEAEVKIRIQPPQGLTDSLLSSLPIGNVSTTQQLIDTYVEILTSRTVVETMMEKTHIEQTEGHLVTYENMLKRINTKIVKDTEIVDVNVQAKNPREAKVLVNTLVDIFLQRVTGLTQSSQSSVRKFIGERLIDAKKEMLKAQTNVENYQKDQRIISTDAETNLLVDQMTKMKELAAQNDLDLENATARWEKINSQLAGEKAELVADSPLITQYKSQLSQLEINLVGLLEKYTAKHPDVLAVQAQIKETKSRLNEEIKKVLLSEAPSVDPIHQNLLQAKLQMEAEIDSAKAQQTAIAKTLKSYDMKITELPPKFQSLARLTLDAKVSQEIYEMLAQRYEEARISEAMEPTDIQIIDMAVTPDKPIKPQKALNILIAGFLGLFAGTGLAFFLEYVNKTVNDADDVRNYLGLPVLGNIPMFEDGEEASGFDEFKNMLLAKKKKKSHRHNQKRGVER